jgi:hypothetical protein
MYKLSGSAIDWIVGMIDGLEVDITVVRDSDGHVFCKLYKPTNNSNYVLVTMVHCQDALCMVYSSGAVKYF